MQFKLQLKRFIFVGIISTIINFIIYLIVLKISSNIILSSYIGYSAGLINAYIFGNKWVFEARNKFTFKQLSMFILIYLIGATLMSMVIFISTKFGIGIRLSWFFGLIVSIINNFFGSKYLVFR